MQTLGKIFAFIIVLFIAVLVSFLQTHIIISMAGMYELSFITKLSFMQVFGLMLILGLAKYKHSESKSKDTFTELMSKWLSNALSNCVSYLLMWGIAYLILLIAF